ncbi:MULTISPECIES: hypothetical protein [unclassified Microbacterium]|uniref:hypothetical protein n=1 Tax=unclassified Microbacterium TaxID=2609290 RepID=UPI0022F04FC4|nr:hypothetical protein [Streptomyces sp. MS2A]
MRARIGPVLVGVALAIPVLAVLVTLGAPWGFSIAWLLLVAAGVVVARRTVFDDTGTWPPAEPERPVVGSDVSRLAWSINPRTGVAGHAIVRRVQRVVRRRLSRRGLDLDDPASAARIDALLGQDLRKALTAKEVRRDDLRRILDAVDRLAPAAADERHDREDDGHDRSR